MFNNPCATCIEFKRKVILVLRLVYSSFIRTTLTVLILMKLLEETGLLTTARFIGLRYTAVRNVLVLV